MSGIPQNLDPALEIVVKKAAVSHGKVGDQDFLIFDAMMPGILAIPFGVRITVPMDHLELIAMGKRMLDSLDHDGEVVPMPDAS